MTLASDISIYSQLFDNEIEKDYEYFKQFYSIPVKKDALLEILRSSSLSALNPESSIHVLKEIFNHGIYTLSELVDFPVDLLTKNGDFVSETWTTNRGDISISSSLYGKLDVEGDDITTLNDKSSSNPTEKNTFDFEGDDITTLHAATKKNTNSMIPPSSSIETEDKSLENDRDNSEKDSSKFDSICNVIQILQLWFQNLYESNRALYKKKNSLGKETSLDLIVDLFNSSDLKAPQYIRNFSVLLAQLKWYLSSCLSSISNSETTNISSLSVIRDIIYLLAEILRCICWSLGTHSSSSNEFVIIKSLLYTFYTVDFYKTFDDLFLITSFKVDGEQVIFPKLRLSPETLITLFKLIGVLSSTPSVIMPENLDNGSSQYTSISSESLNAYNIHIKDKKFDLNSYSEQVSSRLLPFFAIDFSHYYKFKPDLMRSKDSNTSFMRWLTGNIFNDNPYSTYKTMEQVTSINENFRTLSIMGKKDDPFLKDFQKIYDSRIKQSKEFSDSLETFDFLPISLALHYFCKNSSFKKIFLDDDKSKDPSHEILPFEDTEIHLFEIWLCLLSYNFQYHYTSKYLQAVTKVSLLLLLELISDSNSTSSIEKISNYEINEFKWKLCHQKLPVIPNCVNKQGYKSGIFYILDVLQVLLRFNLTRKLETENFRLAILIAYKIIDYLYTDIDRTDIGNYAWSDFFKTIINLLAFIKRQDLINFRYFLEQNGAESIKAMVEEASLLINFLLSSKFAGVLCNDIYSSESRSIIYDLIYEIFHNWEVLNDLMIENELYDSKNLECLATCLNYYKTVFCSSHENDASDSTIKELDYDSPILVKSILECISLLEKKSSSVQFDRNNFTFTTTFSLDDTKSSSRYINSSSMIKVYNIIFSAGYEKL